MNRLNPQTIQDKITSRFDKDYSEFLSYMERETNLDIKEFWKNILIGM